MKITFYGTRGSCPTPGPSTLKYGGNTACVLVESEGGQKLILDAGTGIRVVGDEFVKHNEDVFIVLSHNHYDHIQGFPFFKPIYQKGRNVYIYPSETTPNQPRAVVEQMNGSFFPLDEHELLANLNFKQPNWDIQPLTINGFRVYRRTINHPNGGSAYIIESGGKKVAYVTDNELAPPDVPSTTSYEWKEFLLGVDLVIHDGQYTDLDMPLKHGWGHSLIDEAVDLAKSSHIKQLAIYSHDPDRTDDDIDAWQEKIDKMQLDCNIFFAKEQQIIQL
ncbi:MBL fold metallo-hydrolase [Psychrosphaera aquimarina]|uniref:MBL fold metallo-hydrolase n=1 Tax=Psychrosphaera aquimarina TaxID=2044854 RepID=A0ABU3R1Q1_9GAMM|nr:MBL fold metallo-hydrolase [Psychrosphaera aquimarina]MDU0113605.1 MBL fold metallo-hydrolase [Psychrosphaera aquimarina]